MTSSLTLIDGVPKYQIFPAIGIARVGDSRAHSYIASEAPQIDFVPRGGYRGPEEAVQVDEMNPVKPILGPDFPPVNLRRRVKRMGCRFRIYEFDPNGIPLREINSASAEIEWRVHLVNKKAAGGADWGLGLADGDLNIGLTSEQLTIDTNQQSLSGIDAGPLEMAGVFMSNTSAERSVKLGDLTTEAKGRLIVYGGHGIAEGWEEPPRLPTAIRNPGWYDDTSDGIVEATLTVGGERFEALSARIVVGPPDYAHPCLAPVTLFDLAFDRKGGWGIAVPRPQTSITKHIHPILHRAAFLEWTLFAIRASHYGRTPKHGHGVTANHDMHPDGAFLEPSVFNTLLVQSPLHPDYEDGKRRREMYFDYLKDPSGMNPPQGQGGPFSMPAIEGLTFTSVQYNHFLSLKSGNFSADWPPDRHPSTLDQPELSAIPISDRPEAHNRAAMDFAVGGPFFPGVEIGVIAAEETTYSRIENMDAMIDFRVADSVSAGDLTESLALPWQTAFNQHNYRTTQDSADNLWPSARPVLVPAKKSGTSDDMLWTRPFTQTGSNLDIFERQKMRSNQHMIDNWCQLGFIAPATFYIEVSRTLQEDPDFPI